MVRPIERSVTPRCGETSIREPVQVWVNAFIPPAGELRLCSWNRLLGHHRPSCVCKQVICGEVVDLTSIRFPHLTVSGRRTLARESFNLRRTHPSSRLGLLEREVGGANLLDNQSLSRSVADAVPSTGSEQLVRGTSRHNLPFTTPFRFSLFRFKFYPLASEYEAGLQPITIDAPGFGIFLSAFNTPQRPTRFPRSYLEFLPWKPNLKNPKRVDYFDVKWVYRSPQSCEEVASVPAAKAVFDP